MKHLKLIFLTFTVLTVSKVGMCQSEPENMKKYWNYRDRLKKYFLKIGNGQANSLPGSCEKEYFS
jgi:hypothetical protein